MKKALLTLFIALLTSHSLWAHDFTVVQNGQKLYFNITDTIALTAEVTYGGCITDMSTPKTQGSIVIPQKVQHGNKTYTVTAIGQKAFANSTELTDIVIPTGISSIRDFAFEGCANLRNVVFPSNPVKFGQGTFFLCSALENITFGSDWTQIDFAMFRWSDNIKEISVPAKVEKMFNINYLKGLKDVTVDGNNSQYTSQDGIIYTKDKKALLAVPLAYEGIVNIAEGTTVIKLGAMMNCKNIAAIELPATMEKFSFREFGKIQSLQSITFHGDVPAYTAKKDGKEIFALKVANPNVKVYVPKKALKDYKSSIDNKDSEYKDPSDKATIPYSVKSDDLVAPKNITAVKSKK